MEYVMQGMHGAGANYEIVVTHTKKSIKKEDTKYLVHIEKCI